jgi:hypothetical protein
MAPARLEEAQHVDDRVLDLVRREAHRPGTRCRPCGWLWSTVSMRSASRW